MFMSIQKRWGGMGRGTQHLLARKVYGSDRIGIVGFGETGFVIARPAEPHAAWLLERSQQLHTKVAGNTNMTDGLRKSVEMLKMTPPGILRRIWLLSDGEANREVDSLWSTVLEARAAFINVNTIGFGDQFDEGVLRRLSAATHRGQFVPVRTLRELTDALVIGSNGDGGPKHHHHRAETTVLCIDLSTSMNGAMEGTTKVTVVEQAVLALLHYKQQCFS